MVCLFLVASLQGTVPYSLFYRFYEETSGDSQENYPPLKLEDESLSINQIHCQQVNRVVELLHSQYYFRKDTSSQRNAEKDIQFLERDDSLQDIDVGSFRLNKRDPFPTDMRAICLSVNGVGFALVCYHHENRQLAETNLKLLTQHLYDFCHFISNPTEILSKPEKVQIVLNKYLPYGQLMVMNHRLIRQLERETEAAMKGVTS